MKRACVLPPPQVCIPSPCARVSRGLLSYTHILPGGGSPWHASAQVVPLDASLPRSSWSVSEIPGSFPSKCTSPRWRSCAHPVRSFPFEMHDPPGACSLEAMYLFCREIMRSIPGFSGSRRRLTHMPNLTLTCFCWCCYPGPCGPSCGLCFFSCEGCLPPVPPPIPVQSVGTLAAWCSSVL